MNQSEQPKLVSVRCNGVVGVLDVGQGTINLTTGEQLPCSDFAERAVGRGADWATTVRVDSANGTTMTLAHWMQMNNVSIRNGASGAHHTPNSQQQQQDKAALVDRRQPDSIDPQGDEALHRPTPKRQRPNKHGPSLDAMKAHLAANVFIGHKPGDPTPPPGTLPPATLPVRPEAQHIRLSDWSYERLLAEAASTQGINLNDILLPDPPGVPSERLAYISGQAPVKNLEKVHGQGKEALGPRPESRTDSMHPKTLSAPPEAAPPHSLQDGGVP